MHTPLLRLLFDCSDYSLVEGLSLLKQTVKGELTNLRPHGRLSKVGNGSLVALDSVRSLVGVRHLDVVNTVDVKGDVVSSDGNLRGNLDCLLSEVVHILDGVDERNFEVDAGLELPVVLFEAMKHQSVVFRHNHDEPKVGPVVFADSCRVVLLAWGYR